MKEFEFIEGSLEAQGLYEGSDLQCTYSDDPNFHFGCFYLVYKDSDGLYLMDEHGCEVCGAQGLVRFRPSLVQNCQINWNAPVFVLSEEAEEAEQVEQVTEDKPVDGYKAFDLIRGLI